MEAHSALHRVVPQLLPNWNFASDLVTSFQGVCSTEQERFTRLYDRSKSLLAPLSDPLDTVFPLHRQLSSSREEVYSDWLEWVLAQISDPVLIGRILRSPNPEKFGMGREPLEVRRELPVAQGHEGQCGRLDVVLYQRDTTIAVIEVKTQRYLELDLQKHKGYRACIDAPDADLILLAIDPPDFDPGGFRFLSWADVCIGLRRIARERLSPERTASTALILAFVGAVEQNLLGFVSPTGSAKRIGKAPQMAAHLERSFN